MVAPTTWLPQLYQRFQHFWDRAVPAAGLALLLWTIAEATATYPNEWRVFLSAALFFVGLAWPWVAYAVFTFLVAPPLYSISIYVAAIILAVLILASRWATRNLGATVLVLIAPALLPWNLEATVPLLAGLWWGELSGALVGGLAALWLKLVAGMSKLPLDLAHLSGQVPAGENIIARFSGFNSLQTLLRFVNPFTDTSQELLLHVLQVLVWALAGYVAGRLAQRVWSDRWRGWAPLLSALPAGAILGVGYALVPELLEQATTDLATQLLDWVPWLLILVVVSAAMRTFYLYLRRPVPRPARRRRGGEKSRPASGREPAPRLGQKPPLEWTPARRPRSAAETDDDIIMLEID